MKEPLYLPIVMLTTSFILAPLPTFPRKKDFFPNTSNTGRAASYNAYNFEQIIWNVMFTRVVLPCGIREHKVAEGTYSSSRRTQENISHLFSSSKDYQLTILSRLFATWYWSFQEATALWCNCLKSTTEQWEMRGWTFFFLFPLLYIA